MTTATATRADSIDMFRLNQLMDEVIACKGDRFQPYVSTDLDYRTIDLRDGDNAYSIEFEPKGLVIAAHIYRHDINVETVLLKDELSIVLLFVRVCDQLQHA